MMLLNLMQLEEEGIKISIHRCSQRAGIRIILTFSQLLLVTDSGN